MKFSLPDVAASPETTDVRIKNYGDGTKDPELAVLYYQMGRYLLISSSREDNPLPTNSQGIWGDGLEMPWKADYKANINYEMFYCRRRRRIYRSCICLRSGWTRAW